MAKLAKFHFLGLGKKSGKAPEETEEEKKARLAKEAKKTDDDEGDDDEDDDDEDDDEDEEDGEDADQRKARLGRNALRAAGHRRGVAAALTRVATVMNGLEPGKVAMGLQLALNTDLPGAQIRTSLDAMTLEAVDGTDRGFNAAMDRMTEQLPAPSFGGHSGKPGKPSLKAAMAKTLGLDKQK